MSLVVLQECSCCSKVINYVCLNGCRSGSYFSLTVLVLLQTAFEQIYLQECDWVTQTLTSSADRNSNSTLDKVLFIWIQDYQGNQLQIKACLQKKSQ